MKAYKIVVFSSLLLGIVTLFGLILGTGFGKIEFDVGILSAMGTAFIDFMLLLAAKSVVETELKLEARDNAAKRKQDGPRVEVA